MPSECSSLSGPGCIALLLPAGRLAAYELAGSVIEDVAAPEDRRHYRTKQQCDECNDSHCRQLSYGRFVGAIVYSLSHSQEIRHLSKDEQVDQTIANRRRA